MGLLVRVWFEAGFDTNQHASAPGNQIGVCVYVGDRARPGWPAPTGGWGGQRWQQQQAACGNEADRITESERLA